MEIFEPIAVNSRHILCFKYDYGDVRDYYAAWEAASGYELFPSFRMSQLYEFFPSRWTYVISRQGLCFDTASLGSGYEIISAKLLLTFGYLRADRQFHFVVVPAEGLSEPMVLSDYGYLRTQTLNLGSLSSNGLVTGVEYELILNQDGISRINKNGYTKFGLRISHDIACNPVGGDEQTFVEEGREGPLTLVINDPEDPPAPPPVSGGFIWVEGTKLAYLDNYRIKRLKEGTQSGATGQTAGHLWVEGTDLRYVDSSGNERYITGTQEGATGKTPSQIWIEDTKFRYIDNSGNERYIEGSLA